ncbi:hypothetical protein DESUT3_34720 [Desulfuromonas versatilis]|uniref:AMIN domain-containing protein n=1 Tax=Desulfuromonas versatilis TaxID=2802975 RepID=A0ABM8HVQ5_9BACT|nr:tetratricopeptide repeat protein [Desulfuromonas versatilis]BCR06403.1 hypothetical protein DESUT3_34720 [Desulfuromonas versatilis]
MSLINQMLKDLEARKQQAAADPVARPALGASVTPGAPGRGRRQRLVPAGLVLLALLAFWGVWGWYGTPPAAPPAVVDLQVPPAPLEPAEAEAAEPALADTPAEAEPTAPLAQAAIPEPELPPVAEAEPPAATSPVEISAPEKTLPEPRPALSKPAPGAPAKAAGDLPAALPPAPTVELRNLRITEQAGYLRLVAFFAGVPDYRLQRDAGNRRLVVELPNTRFDGTLPAPPRESPLVRSIELERGQGQLRLVLQMKGDYRYLEQFESKGRRFGDRLVLDLYAAGPPVAQPQSSARADGPAEAARNPQAPAPTELPSAPMPSPGQVPQAPNTGEDAGQALARARTALAAGRPAEAEELLGQALRLQPASIEARQLLVEQLLGAGRISEAEPLLNEGLALHPGHPLFRRGYARLLVDRGELIQARDLLIRGGLPEVGGDPEHHALLAAVYQRLGDFALAEQAYRRVLSVAPSAGVWWMGLGIALESQGRGPEASAAYQGALRSGQLGADLRRYVEGRLAALH